MAGANGTLYLYAWAGMGNLGDDEILRVAIQIASECGIDFSILLEPDAVKPEFLDSAAVLKWPRHKSSLTEKRKFHRAITSSRGILFVGGGWMGGDRGIREPLNWLLRLLPLRKSLMATHIGFGPYDGFATQLIGRALGRWISQRRPLQVRTHADGEQLARLGIPNHKVVFDLALAGRHPDSTAKRLRNRCIVVLPPPEAYGATKGRDWELSLVQEIEQHWGELDFIYLSMQHGESNDLNIWGRHFAQSVSPTLPSDALALFETAEYAICGRLHAAIFALNAGVPKVASLPYHHKFDLLRVFGISGSDGGDPSIYFHTPDFERYELAKCSAALAFRSVLKELTE